MTDFLTADTNLPSYMMFPRFLLDMEINETAKMLYIILLDRARLSQKNEGWSDTDGHVFIYFTRMRHQAPIKLNKLTFKALINAAQPLLASLSGNTSMANSSKILNLDTASSFTHEKNTLKNMTPL